MNILALIPARGGSKGIPMKNIKKFGEKELIYWSIKIAKESKYINRIIVSTDNEQIKEVALKYGAEVPFIRPLEISNDLSNDYEFIKHCMDYLKDNGENIPDIIVQLRPTYPTRKLEILDETIKIFIDEFNNYDSLRTVYKFEKSPFKMYMVNNKNLIPLFKNINNINEPYNQCRQLLPETYIHNGYIDIIKSKIIYDKHSITGDLIYPYIMSKDEYNDIDTEEDWQLAEKKLNL
jgi:CMP-N-acetylneuraminic acid synthetase